MAQKKQEQKVVSQVKNESGEGVKQTKKKQYEDLILKRAWLWKSKQYPIGSVITRDMFNSNKEFEIIAKHLKEQGFV